MASSLRCMPPDRDTRRKQKFRSLKQSVQFASNRRWCFFAEFDNVPKEITNAAVQKLCSEYGNITTVQGLDNFQTTANTRKVSVGFASPLCAFAAQEALNNYDIGKDASLGREHLLRVRHNPGRKSYVAEGKKHKCEEDDSHQKQRLEELSQIHVENCHIPLSKVLIKTMRSLNINIKRQEGTTSSTEMQRVRGILQQFQENIEALSD
uniref:uncharacterized protein LOC120340556 isoform X1 n=1 Tax=Styela clava TaxID=7725 RepID=UPI00193ABFD7|nr:uncharacterized protein LOC120340556 isoform X1 [Styela clava]